MSGVGVTRQWRCFAGPEAIEQRSVPCKCTIQYNLVTGMDKRAKASDGSLLRFGKDRPVVASARNLIREWLQEATEGEGFFHSPHYIIRINALRDDAPAALREALDEAEPVRRLMAAAWLLGIAESDSDLLSRRTYERATVIVGDAIRGDDAYLQEIACRIVSQYGVIEDLLPVLREVVAAGSGPPRVFASIALLRRDPQEIEALRIATAAMRGEDPLLSTIAAVGMLRIEIATDQAPQFVKQNLADLPEEWIYMLLIQLKHLGTKASPVFEVVRRITEDEALAPVIRQQAAACIGSLSAGGPDATPTLLQALRSGDGRLVLGGVEGLQASRQFPSEGPRILLRLLEHKTEDLRAVAAKCIGQWDQGAEEAIPVLVERLNDLARVV